MIRPRLHAVLDGVCQRPVTLVAAGAGFGKSVLLSTWLAQQDGRTPASWLTLHQSDVDASRLGRHLVTAVDSLRFSPSADDGLAGKRLRLASGGDPNALVEYALGLAEELTKPCVLVIDDLQEVAWSGEALVVLNRLLREAPDHLHLVLASRVEPPVALQRLRLLDALVVLRNRDLAFTLGEAAELARRAGLPVTSGELAQLHSVTGGWPAGLRMALLSLKSAPDLSAAVAGFSAQDRALTDYLTSEVLSGMAPRTRAFVLAATVSDEVCGSLVDEVTGSTDGEAMLIECERENLFVTLSHESEGRRWFAWHHVFANHMRLAARFEDPAGAREGARRAAGWWRQRDPLTAARLALGASDVELAEQILADAWLEVSLAGSSPELLHLVSRLRDDSVHAAEFELARCLDLVQKGEADGAVEAMRRSVLAVDRVPDSQRRRLEVRSSLVRLFLVNDRVSLREAVAQGRALMAQLRDGDWVPDRATVALAWLCVGMGEARLQGDVPAALGHLRTAAEQAREEGLVAIELMARSEMCLPLIALGDLDLVERQAHGVLAEAVALGWPRLGSLAVAASVLGWLDYWRGDLEAAMGHFGQARGWLVRTDPTLRGLEAYFRGLTQLAQGDSEAAQVTVQDLQALADSGVMAPFGASIADSLRAELRLAVGDVGGALGVVLDRDHDVTYRLAACTRAEVLRRAGRPHEALVELDAIPTQERFSHVVTLAEVIRTLVWSGVGRAELAHEALEAALTAAAPHGLVQPLLARGVELEPILARHLLRGTAHPELVARLLDLVARPVDQDAQGRHQALTQRELTMLRYLSTPLSHREIAAEQFVSVNTVKTHVAKVYRKLGVNGRREAVRRAQELGLLSGPGQPSAGVGRPARR